jgi:hypothetical protein
VNLGNLVFGLLLLLPLLLLTTPAQARITRLEILRTEPAFGDQAFGEAGPYQHLFARAHGEVDPADPRNAAVQDLNLAPRNARGMVEYTTEVELLKPSDKARGNRILFFEVNNRGNKLAVNAFDANVAGGIAERNALASPGDGHLMRAGFTMVWWGWEMDVRAGMNRILMPPVVAHNPDGSPITGIVRSEIIVRRTGISIPLSTSQQPLSYPSTATTAIPRSPPTTRRRCRAVSSRC